MYYMNPDGTIEQVKQPRCNCKKCREKEKGKSSWFCMKNIIIFLIVIAVLYVLFTCDYKSWLGISSQQPQLRTPPPPPPKLVASSSPATESFDLPLL